MRLMTVMKYVNSRYMPVLIICAYLVYLLNLPTRARLNSLTANDRHLSFF